MIVDIYEADVTDEAQRCYAKWSVWPRPQSDHFPFTLTLEKSTPTIDHESVILKGGFHKGGLQD